MCQERRGSIPRKDQKRTTRSQILKENQWNLCGVLGGEYIDEVVSVESMKDAEKVLWFTHYNQLCDKLNYVIGEKCPGRQTNEPNQLAHELCVMSSSEQQVNLCFEEAYKCMLWGNVIDHW